MSQQVKRREIDPSKGKNGFSSYDAYNQTGVEWLGEIPSHWDTTKVGFHTDLENGYAFSSEHFCKDTGLPLIRIRDLGAEDTEAYYDAPPPTSFRVENGDIVIGMDGDFEVDRWSGEPALLNQRLCCLKPREKVDSRFLFYSLPLPLDIINDLTHSTTVKHLSSKQVRNIAITFPSFSEQTAIGRFLDNKTAQIDLLIDKKKRLIELLEERRAALITKAVTKGLDPDVPTKDSGVEWLGDVPEDWGVTKLRWVLSYLSDGTHGSHSRQTEGVPLLSAENVRDGQVYVDDDVRRITEKEYQKITARTQPQQGDLLLTIVGTLGRAAILTTNQKIAFQRSVALLRPGVTMTSEYLRFVTQSQWFQFRLNARSKTSAQSGVYLSDVASIWVPVPPKEAQRQITHRLKDQERKFSKLTDRARMVIDHLREYRSALITAAVTGKIDVRNHAA